MSYMLSSSHDDFVDHSLPPTRKANGELGFNFDEASEVFA